MKGYYMRTEINVGLFSANVGIILGSFWNQFGNLMCQSFTQAKSKWKNQMQTMSQAYSKYTHTNTHKCLGIEEKIDPMNRDLWGIFQAKTKYQAEADDKVKSVEQGEGICAYVKVHSWFNQAAEQGMVKLT